jgi:hypothetical protein
LTGKCTIQINQMQTARAFVYTTGSSPKVVD